MTKVQVNDKRSKAKVLTFGDLEVGEAFRYFYEGCERTNIKIQDFICRQANALCLSGGGTPCTAQFKDDFVVERVNLEINILD